MGAVERHDVIVVGAGPAGCAAAAAVRQSDAGALRAGARSCRLPRDKACGDGIAYEAIETLADLGFDLPKLLDRTAAVQRLAVRSAGGVEVRPGDAPAGPGDPARVVRRPVGR